MHNIEGEKTNDKTIHTILVQLYLNKHITCVEKPERHIIKKIGDYT